MNFWQFLNSLAGMVLLIGLFTLCALALVPLDMAKEVLQGGASLVTVAVVYKIITS